jgi:hypothetical protein
MMLKLTIFLPFQAPCPWRVTVDLPRLGEIQIVFSPAAETDNALRCAGN